MKTRKENMKCNHGEGTKMAVLAQNKANMFVIKQSKGKDFIEESNKNKISKSFLDECKEVAKLFSHEKKDVR